MIGLGADVQHDPRYQRRMVDVHVHLLQNEVETINALKNLQDKMYWETEIEQKQGTYDISGVIEHFRDS